LLLIALLILQPAGNGLYPLINSHLIQTAAVDQAAQLSVVLQKRSQLGGDRHACSELHFAFLATGRHILPQSPRSSSGIKCVDLPTCRVISQKLGFFHEL